MKFAAHPLVVAVALGLLGPTSLEEQEERHPSSDSPCAGCDAEELARFAADSAPVDSDELARAEAEYHRVSLLLS